jgi:hypothetical protein
MDSLIAKQMEEIPKLDLPDVYKVYLLDNLPVCEQCYDQYTKQFRPGVKQGRELDHITPVNPEDAMNTMDIYGEPLSFDNVQLLCNRDHSEKSGRDQLFHKNIKK